MIQTDNIETRMSIAASCIMPFSAKMVVLFYIKQDWYGVFLGQYIMWDIKIH